MIPENLILKFLSNEANDQEIDQLHPWLSEDPENQRILTGWMDAYYHQYENEIIFNSNKGLKILHNKIDRESRVIVPEKEKSGFGWMKIAASIALLVILSFGALFFTGQFDSGQLVMLERSNPYGQKSIFQLSDGTIVKLNAGSKLRYPEKFSDSTRIVHLQGEAFFEVTKNPDKPFIVSTGEIETRVLGTSFNITAYDNDENITVAVATGKVAVKHQSGKQVLLLPEEQASFRKNEGRLLKSSADLDKVLAWRENVLRFDAATFNEVEKKLEMWYGIEVDLSKMKATDCTITGKFRNENLINVLEAISLSTGVEHVKRDSAVVFSGGCR